jgi:23S rRNA (guanine745-N1)-methyltransferase
MPVMTRGMAGAVPFLACPYCEGPLRAVADGAALRCPVGHSFDVARQGYVSLLARQARASGDDAAMVEARRDFLARGHYAGIARLLTALAVGGVDGPGCVCDIGAGTGYYLARVLEALPDRAGVAVDASKFAARRAARCHERAGAVVADAWRRLPLADGAAALLLNVFAPRVGAEFHRALRPGGALVVVTPTPRHLVELVEPLGLVRVDARKADRLAAEFDPWFTREAAEDYEAVLPLRHGDVAALVAMTPSARHVDAAALAARVATLPDPLPVTVSVLGARYRAAT